MKKIAVLACGICMLGAVAQAQTVDSKYGVDSVKTITNASIYTELVKQKNFEEALPAWRYVFLNAPAFQMNTYIRGEDIIEFMIKKTKKKEYVDTLMMVFDQRIKYFGDNPKYGEGYLLGRKGLALFMYSNNDVNMIKQSYATLRKAFEIDGPKIHPNTVVVTFGVASELAKKGELDREEFINLYMKLADFLTQRINEGKKAYADSKAKIDGILFDSGMADCKTLADLLTPRFEADKTNLENLKEISSLLKRRECTDLPLYAAVAEELYKLEPSADAAYSLAMMFGAKKDFARMEQYIKEAIDKSTDPQSRCDYYLRLAQIYMAKKDFAKVKTLCQSALKDVANCGQAYILIGKAYAFGSEKYEGDDFDKHTVFWAAVDKFIKAKQVDPSVASEADGLIKQYSVYFPTKDEGFFRSITAGSSVKIGGWINETTTARFRE